MFNDIADYVRIPGAQKPRFSGNGRRLAFLSNRDGTPQIYLLETDTGDVRQLTQTASVIYDFAFRPAHDQLIYMSDVGGDEQHQLHLLDLTNGQTTPLVAEIGVINTMGSWSADGRFLSYASNRRDRRFYDIWLLDPDGGGSHCVLQQDGMNAPGPFSIDQRALLISRPNLDQPGDNDLWLIVLQADGRATAEPRRLTPHRESAQWQARYLYPSGTVLALSDETHEFTALQRIDGVSGERRYLLSYDWDMEDVTVSADSSRLAVVVNEDGYSRIEAYTLAADGILGERLSIPELPAGIVSSPRWRPDNQSVLFAFEGARHTPAIWQAETGTAKPQRTAAAGVCILAEDVLIEPQLIRYPSFDESQIPAWFYRPQTGSAPWPCLIIVHGGQEAQSRPALWGRYAAAHYLLSQGIALLVPNVRGSTGYGKTYEHADDREKRPDAVRDLLAAADWLENNSAIDAGRIALLGPSYGGFMVLAAATLAPQRWAAVIDLYGVVNFETLLQHTGVWRRRHRAREYGDDPQLLRSLSPIHQAQCIRAPLLVVQGERDVRVPPEESEQIVAAVTANGTQVEYVVYPNEGHGIEQLAHRLDLAQRIVAFCRRHLA
jgi:dipeptidyl aminopeptidase/acylaminoacyl peptidase